MICKECQEQIYGEDFNDLCNMIMGKNEVKIEMALSQKDIDLLDQLATEIQSEWQSTGLFEGIYRDFFLELLARYESKKKERGLK
jgi:hypothetical protein